VQWEFVSTRTTLLWLIPPAAYSYQFLGGLDWGEEEEEEDGEE